MNYRILELDLRNALPKQWRGMDVRGMALGQQFYGCQYCGVQFDVDARETASANQCPNCTGPLYVFTVTHADLAVLEL